MTTTHMIGIFIAHMMYPFDQLIEDSTPYDSYDKLGVDAPKYDGVTTMYEIPFEADAIYQEEYCNTLVFTPWY